MISMTSRTASCLISLVLGLVMTLPESSTAQERGVVSVSGVINPAGQLEVGPAPPYSSNILTSIRSINAQTVLLDLEITGTGQPSSVYFPLIIRTNAPRFKIIGSADIEIGQGNLSIGNAYPTGSGKYVVPGAARRFQGHSHQLGKRMLLATGTQVSFRGSFMSPNNGLLSQIEFRFEAIPEGTTQRRQVRIELSL